MTFSTNSLSGNLSIPIVGIVLPVYNGGDLLDICLESLSKQTYFCFELLILDDSSDDNTREIVEKFMGKESNFPIRFFRSKKRRGFYRSLQLLLRFCRNEYYLVIGDDDYLDENYFSKLCLSDGVRNGAAIVATKTIGVNIKTKRKVNSFHLKDGFYNSNYFLNNFFGLSLGNLYCNLLRRDMFGIESYRKIAKKIPTDNFYFDLLKRGFLNDLRILVCVFSEHKKLLIFYTSSTSYYKGIKDLSPNINTHDGRTLSPVGYATAVFFGLFPLLTSNYFRFRWFGVLYFNILRAGIGCFRKSPSKTNLVLIINAIFLRAK